MKALFANVLCNLLKAIRYAEPTQALSALSAFHALVVWLRFIGGINADHYSRLLALAVNACRYSLKTSRQISTPGPGGKNRVDSPSASASPNGLRLLCLLVPSRTGGIRTLPVHTLHRMSPYTSLHGSYRNGTGRWSVALNPLDVPGGTGFYLRETHARAPSAEVLARCLRQRQAHALRAHPRAVRAGGLSHA